MCSEPRHVIDVSIAVDPKHVDPVGTRRSGLTQAGAEQLRAGLGDLGEIINVAAAESETNVDRILAELAAGGLTPERHMELLIVWAFRQQATLERVGDALEMMSTRLQQLHAAVKGGPFDA